MAKLSLQQLFGANAYQDSTYLVISKQDLVGLTPLIVNTSESILAALILTAYKQFEGVIEDENKNTIVDERNAPITYNNSQLYELLNIFYWKGQFIKYQSQPKILHSFVIESNEI